MQKDNQSIIPGFWIRIIFFNLLLVATIGVILRYKIAFYLPFIDQKHFLHAHSHFAFTGWVTQALMVLLTHYLCRKQPSLYTKYKWLLIANLIAAYGMLLSFPVQGYGVVSITFSTLSILVSYLFAIIYWQDLNLLPYQVGHSWFKAALLFAVISSAGTFALSTMMATRTIHQNWYLASIYFYLHFQYNGWFFFACMGLFFIAASSVIPLAKQKAIFWLFFLACIPAYVLSALWLPLPEWVHAIVTIAAIFQLIGWGLLLRYITAHAKSLSAILGKGAWLFVLAAIALTIKLLLQLGSTIHFLSDLAFGFRPIVIGYLHLVLLGIITLFIIGYFFQQAILVPTRKIMIGLSVFVAGIILNELLLMTQGISAISYHAIPYMNESLFGAALIMWSGVLVISLFIKSNEEPGHHYPEK